MSQAWVLTSSGLLARQTGTNSSGNVIVEHSGGSSEINPDSPGNWKKIQDLTPSDAFDNGTNANPQIMIVDGNVAIRFDRDTRIRRDPDGPFRGMQHRRPAGTFGEPDEALYVIFRFDQGGDFVNVDGDASRFISSPRYGYFSPSRQRMTTYFVGSRSYFDTMRTFDDGDSYNQIRNYALRLGEDRPSLTREPWSITTYRSFPDSWVSSEETHSVSY